MKPGTYICSLILAILLWNLLQMLRKDCGIELRGLSPRVNYTDRVTAACL
jgi:hypothetical protein